MQGQIFMTKSVGCILIIWTIKSVVAAQIDAIENWNSNIELLLDLYYYQ